MKVTAAMLLKQIQTGAFDYLLVRKHDALSQCLKSDVPGCVIFDGPYYRVIKICADIRSQLETILRTIDWERLRVSRGASFREQL